MYIVAAFYQFARFDDPARLRDPLLRLSAAHGLCGSILLAPEGVNGTVAGPEDGITALIAHLRALPGCADLTWKRSTSESRPFGRMKVRLKREIVTMGRPEADPTQAKGTYVAPEDWNALIADPETVVIDTRNAYEVAIGSFAGAIDPGIESFGEFPDWWAENRARFAGRKVAMFCTGGIRCEKSTALLRHEGLDAVYHLEGGILKYLETVPEAESRWSGACFVFDQRVALRHGLEECDHVMCYGCRRPVAPKDQADPAFELGVACPACYDGLSEDDRARFRERQRQIDLARRRGDAHLGQAGGREGPGTPSCRSSTLRRKNAGQ